MYIVEIFEIDESELHKKWFREFYKSKAFMDLTPIQGSQKAMYQS